jgi:hypothetical protein
MRLPASVTSLAEKVQFTDWSFLGVWPMFWRRDRKQSIKKKQIQGHLGTENEAYGSMILAAEFGILAERV